MSNNINDIMNLLYIVWMFNTVSIALGIIGGFYDIWNDIFG